MVLAYRPGRLAAAHRFFVVEFIMCCVAGVESRKVLPQADDEGVPVWATVADDRGPWGNDSRSQDHRKAGCFQVVRLSDVL